MTAKKWEYRFLNHTYADRDRGGRDKWLAQLNEAGAQGWEIVGMVDAVATHRGHHSDERVSYLLAKRPLTGE